MEKEIKDMGEDEIRSLKRKYKKEFRDMLLKFFEDRPLLEVIELREDSYLGMMYCNHISLSPENDSVINDVILYGGKKGE